MNDIQRAIDAVWRIESAKIIATVARMVREVGLAEELAQDALVAALERWPQTGIPTKPGAWLTTVAKHSAIDHLRRRKLLERKHEELGRELEAELETAASFADAMNQDEDIDDDLLRLLFVACHPILSPEARVALTLRLLGGLTTDEIARAFLISEATVAQRIVRAKRTLAEAKVPFEVPRAEERTERLASVLAVLYLIFNEGYAATAGESWMRPSLCEEALRLGRMLAELAPQEAEVHGLVALMEIQASRLRARSGPDGEPILLLEQDRSRWDYLLIGRGLSALKRAEGLADQGSYTLQAAIAACHARARTAQETDWKLIVGLYDALLRQTQSPIVELNRAVAVSMADGHAAGLALADALTENEILRNYHLLPCVRGDLLLKLGRQAEARAEFERAAALTRNLREQALMLKRAKACS
ncbi:MAG: sigma-70 family RNA polymerase sigma factor [Burkholderiaceae bacterium]|nr:sigma-70 family RNA polymerase sigma factor [Burkholderiaceae bacterium]